jgi:hypothetical protein
MTDNLPEQRLPAKKRREAEMLYALAEQSLSGFLEEEPDLYSAAGTARASESSLEKDWQRPEEDKVWKIL